MDNQWRDLPFAQPTKKQGEDTRLLIAEISLSQDIGGMGGLSDWNVVTRVSGEVDNLEWVRELHWGWKPSCGPSYGGAVSVTDAGQLITDGKVFLCKRCVSNWRTYLARGTGDLTHLPEELRNAFWHSGE